MVQAFSVPAYMVAFPAQCPASPSVYLPTWVHGYYPLGRGPGVHRDRFGIDKRNNFGSRV